MFNTTIRIFTLFRLNQRLRLRCAVTRVWSLAYLNNTSIVSPAVLLSGVPRLFRRLWYIQDISVEGIFLSRLFRYANPGSFSAYEFVYISAYLNIGGFHSHVYPSRRLDIDCNILKKKKLWRYLHIRGHIDISRHIYARIYVIYGMSGEFTWLVTVFRESRSLIKMVDQSIRGHLWLFHSGYVLVLVPPCAKTLSEPIHSWEGATFLFVFWICNVDVRRIIARHDACSSAWPASLYNWPSNFHQSQSCSVGVGVGDVNRPAYYCSAVQSLWENRHRVPD